MKKLRLILLFILGLFILAYYFNHRTKSTYLTQQNTDIAFLTGQLAIKTENGSSVWPGVSNAARVRVLTGIFCG